MKQRTRLNITKCIVIGDARRLEAGKLPVRNIRGLAIELEAQDESKYDADKIYYVLYHFNGKGMMEVDGTLLQDIMKILSVEECELIK